MKTIIKNKLLQWNLANKRVFLRADLNVPLSDGKIKNDFRLLSIIPTLDFLINHNANIVLATHLGRPKNEEPELSTQILLPWFEQHGYVIRFEADLTKITHASIVPKEVILIENLRFFPGEKNNDPFFAKQLVRTAQYYVNDAFGMIHEHDCSVASLPYEFPEDKRSIGFLIEKELYIFDKIKYHPQHPFVAILGGKKIKDKIPLIQSLVDKVDTLLLCPALCFSFLKALKIPVGKSLVDDTTLQVCKQIVLQAEKSNTKYIFPIDYQIAYDSFDGKLDTVDATQFPHNAIGISVGQKTVEEFTTIINQAKTVFLNCAMGFSERPETQESTKTIIAAMAQSSAYTIIAGGDSVDSALQTTCYAEIDHLSTGGGAALAYLSGALLPGLIPFEEE
jgi:phosphoglycerate kinase